MSRSRRTKRQHKISARKVPSTGPAAPRSGVWLWSCLALVTLLTAALAWDTAGDAYALQFVRQLWQNTPAEETYDPLPINENNQPGSPPEVNLVWIPGGWFWMGSNDENHPDSNPIHKVYVDGLWMGKCEVTNAEWAAFVEATGYKTVAEKKPSVQQLPPWADAKAKADIKAQKPFSIVFVPPPMPVDLETPLWWQLVEGACWKYPLGPGSSIKGMDDHPVVHICYVDCQAFLRWKNAAFPYKAGWHYRLPTEAEWEFAARGGRNLNRYTWGNDLKPDGKWMANIFQGQFPHYNSREDGYERTAPVGSYPPNGFGLCDMAGNVWEWCQDYYLPDYYRHSSERNPTGPAQSLNPQEIGLTTRVKRGGSFLCDACYCERYVVYARDKGDIYSAANHTGFRVVLAAEEASDQ